MLLKDNKSGKYVEINDVLGAEMVAAGIAKRAERRASLASGDPAVAQVIDPNQVVDLIPRNEVSDG